jgi:hypothetical protein
MYFFSEIVKAAHLQPLQKKEILEMHQKKTRVWNNVGLCAKDRNSDATKPNQNMDTTPTKKSKVIAYFGLTQLHDA